MAQKKVIRIAVSNTIKNCIIKHHHSNWKKKLQKLQLTKEKLECIECNNLVHASVPDFISYLKKYIKWQIQNKL